jgi:hypothetical protein
MPSIPDAGTRFAKLIGKYEIAANDFVTIGVQDDSLVAQRTGKAKLVLLKSGPTKFEIGRTELTFLADGTRNLSLLFYGDGINVLARKSE